MKESISALVISILALLLMALQLLGIVEVNNQALVLLGIALVPWLLPFLKSLKLPGGAEFEFQQRLAQMEKKVDVIEENAPLPGKRFADAPSVTDVSPPPPLTTPRRETLLDQSAPLPAGDLKTDPEDPNKGKFGGSPKASGRVLEAVIKPAYGPRSSACDVEIRVRSTEPARPLTGKVKFYLHPSFGRWKQYSVDVKAGEAKDEITSWGAFTIGVEADEGATRLELDLTKVHGGTKSFYEE